APHKKLRRSLEKKSLTELQNLLQKMDPDTYGSIDVKNPRRLIRALEVAILSGESLSKLRNNKPEPLFETLQIGIQRPIEELYQRINNRAEKLIEQGWIDETRKLLKQKYTWNLPSMSSLGYKQIGDYLREEKSLEDAIAGIKRDTRHYARRQITWFKRDKRIHWVDGKNMAEPEKLIREFLETDNAD
ncbi:MAG: tRNA dimethylallyltransferase, partial [Patescibacteria group bacterium]